MSCIISINLTRLFIGLISCSSLSYTSTIILYYRTDLIICNSILMNISCVIHKMFHIFEKLREQVYKVWKSCRCIRKYLYAIIWVGWRKSQGILPSIAHINTDVYTSGWGARFVTKNQGSVWPLLSLWSGWE